MITKRDASNKQEHFHNQSLGMCKKLMELVARIKEERKAGKMDEWMERRKDGWMEGRKIKKKKDENLILFESLSGALQFPRSLTPSHPSVLSLTHAHSQTDRLLVSCKASGKVIPCMN